jgi:hypothetical protein
MSRIAYLVFTQPVAGQDAEFNRWYDEQHLGDLLRVPGVVGARRFRLASDQAGAPGPYLAIYEIESDDVQRTLAEIEARAGTTAMPLTDALDMDRVGAFVYQAITDRRSREA